jgi:hypothetical protein
MRVMAIVRRLCRVPLEEIDAASTELLRVFPRADVIRLAPGVIDVLLGRNAE